MDRKRRGGFYETMKLVTEIQNLAHFARERDKTEKTDAIWTGLYISSRHRQNNDTIPPKAFCIQNMNKAEKLLDRKTGTPRSSMGSRDGA